MNVGSLFSGVGGFDLGLERAGHRVVFQCEADPYRRRVLRRHWPDVPIYEDVREEISGDIDLLCGGFPCQDLSVAGKRAGLAGERSGLFFEFMRIADTLVRPGGWVLIENVAGLLSSGEGQGDMGVVIGTLADLGFLDLAYRVLCSRHFGVPQRRRRVFILARRSSGRRAFQVLLEPESGGGDYSQSRDTRKTTSEGSRPSVASTLQTTAGDYSRADGFNMVLSSETDSDRMREASRLPRRVDDSPVTAFHATQTPIHEDDLTPTLGANMYMGILGQGHPTTSSPVDLKPDGPRYAAMGDAVTVNVAQWIGERLNEHGGDG